MSLMTEVYVASGLSCKESKQVHIVDAVNYGDTIIWTKTKYRTDGSMVSYTWIDPKGEYPFTKDTCCLDSVVYEIKPYAKEERQCYTSVTYDSIKQALDIFVWCDSITAK
jgi:hypothetical protein